MFTYSKFFSGSSLLIIAFLFTGCYTQLHTTNDYYNAAENDLVLRQYAAMDRAGIHYKDFKTEQWYDKHLATGYKWDEDINTSELTDQELDSLYEEHGYQAWTDAEWHNNPHRFHRHYIWGEGFSLYFGSRDFSFTSNFRYNRRGYSPSGHWYYNPAGYWSYWYYPFSDSFHYTSHYDAYWGTHAPYVDAYNYYNNVKRLNENRDNYRMGPRNNGLTDRRVYRKRTGATDHRTRTSTTRSTYEGNSRVRKTGRSGSVGRSRGSSGDGDSSSGSRSRGGNN